MSEIAALSTVPRVSGKRLGWLASRANDDTVLRRLPRKLATSGLAALEKVERADEERITSRIVQ
jgi:hypothetical protein